MKYNKTLFYMYYIIIYNLYYTLYFIGYIY